MKLLASRFGMSGQRAFARRFIAGERVEDAIAAVRAIEAEGLLHTLDYLGESVTSLAAAEAATREYLRVIEEVDRAGVERNLSLKLTQLGLDVDRAICVDNLRKILAAGERCGFFVRIDMESSKHTEATLDIFFTVWRHGSRNVGVVLQSCLYRTENDVARVNALGARIRLVKGAYREPKTVAYQARSDVDAAYLRLAQRLLTEGNYPAIATHDERILTDVKRFAAERGIAKDSYEFQMLYGVRRDLQKALRNEGFRMRVYVPFGREWFPYFMRRLGERPANVAFVIRSLLAER
ncbi:MAG TPA: proline dehydrogenase family protein [Vicinamibacterales bacterium]|nr:proline dehydrogenase family protein [Vicinamibacterales bacterium]